MKPVTPSQLHEGGRAVTFGKSQPEVYVALPASVDEQGTIMTEWELSAEDLSKLWNGGRLRVWLLYTDVNRKKQMTPIVVETIDG